MPKFSANLSVLFTELPLLERFSAAQAAGFSAVEVLFPYEEDAADIQAALVQSQLDLVLINTPRLFSDRQPGGLAAIPGGEDLFRQDLKLALHYAEVLGAGKVHIMAGVTSDLAARTTFVKNLTWATQYAPTQNFTIEPLNNFDMPGYFLNNFDLAADVLDEVDRPNIGLQFDTYHAHQITGDVATCWLSHGGRARHIQIAGIPDRHEPTGGLFDYPSFFDLLDETNYSGYVSAEYHPANSTTNGLGWLPKLRN
ncbi:hydroxypyruvate isomerase family protein [Pseudopelagicola sp. nBUS_19]|uniref:hydroxypyruvate isomerase family protein n=1 Tax=Pseudopelagicola sp. nBUS_19 TaxID=3395316 RepID=UPI003EB834E4